MIGMDMYKYMDIVSLNINSVIDIQFLSIQLYLV